MSASFDNRKLQQLDSAVEMAEHAKRPGASPTSLEAINTGAHTTIYEKAAMQSPITSQEASQISMPAASSIGHENPIQPTSKLRPEQNVDIISGQVGHTKNLALAMMDQGFVADPKAFQTVSLSGNNSFASSQSYFQPSSNSQGNSQAFQPMTSLFQGKNPVSLFVDKMVRNIIDLLF